MNTLLTMAENFSQIGPINALVGKIADRIAPKATAKACSGCLVYCGPGGPQAPYGGRIAVYGTVYGSYCGSPYCIEYQPSYC